MRVTSTIVHDESNDIDYIVRWTDLHSTWSDNPCFFWANGHRKWKGGGNSGKRIKMPCAKFLTILQVPLTTMPWQELQCQQVWLSEAAPSGQSRIAGVP